MPNKASRRKQKKKAAFTFDDFRVVLDLPERLGRLLREMLHVSKAEWDFCLDKVRQYKAWQREKKENKSLPPLPAGSRLYKEWSKSKGPGKGRRYFAAPCPELKVVQKAIELQFLKQIPIHFCRHGSQEGSSILTNARAHAGFAVHMFSVDIINAFPSVLRSRVYANLKKPLIHRLRQFSSVDFSDEDLNLLLNSICDLLCLRDRLPQGPPTSPRVMAIVSNKMDMDLWGLCESNSTAFQRYLLTIYADNITVSSDGPIPEEMREKILSTVRANGFIPHTRADKTKYYSPETGEVPVITGLVILPDTRITMTPGKVNQLRAALHGLLQRQTWDTEVRGKIAGYLGYIRQVYPKTVPSALSTFVEQCEERLATLKRDDALSSQAATQAPAKKKARRPSKGKGMSAKRSKRSSPKNGGKASDVVMHNGHGGHHHNGNGHTTSAPPLPNDSAGEVLSGMSLS